MKQKRTAPTTILLVRHAETQWNIEHRHLGQRDIDLAPIAEKHITQLTRHLAKRDIQAIYSSPLIRCVHTIQPLAEVLNLPLTLRRDLIERDLGEWEGKSPQELEPRHPGYHFPDGAYTGKFRISDSEPIAHLEKRLRHALYSIHKKHPGNTVVVTTHSGVIWTILHRIVNNPPTEFFWPGNCSISTICYQGTHISMQSYEQIF